MFFKQVQILNNFEIFLKKKYFASLRILNLFIKSFVNSFVDLALTFLNSVLNSFLFKSLFFKKIAI